MKKRVYIGILIVLIAGSFLFFTQKDDGAIKIGLVGPFTGNAAFFGDYIERGLNFALTELTPEERSRVEIIKEDDMCAGKNAISAVQKLITIDKVSYVIGPLCNESTLATETLFESNKVISLSIGLPSNTIANMGPYHFSFSPEIEYLAKSLTTEIRKQNLEKIAVIHMIGPFEGEYYKHFLTHLTSQGGRVVADEGLVKGSTDFRNAILKIKQAKPDSIMIVAHTAELNNILKQLSEQNLLNLPKFGIHAAENGVLLQEKDLAEGLIYPYPGDKAESESARLYAQMYREKYNTEPDPSSTNVYDSFKILLGAIEECDYENKTCVQGKLATLKNYQGANGNLSVDERGVGTYKEVMLKIVKDGKFERLNK